LIGLAPENARLGDLVCEYGTRFYLIIREVDRMFESEKKMEVRIGAVLGLNLEAGGANPGTINLCLDVQTIFKIGCPKGQGMLRRWVVVI
jgi:hypothetical protein